MKTVIIIFSIILSLVNTSFGQNRKDSLLVFVGEMIDVKYVPRSPIDTTIRGKDTFYSVRMDSKFAAKYKVLQWVYGKYQADTIEFTVFDHYGEPSFSKYKTALLFVSIHNKKLYHEKYQYFDVYKTTDGRWASPGNPYKLDGNHQKDIQAQTMIFIDNLSFDITNNPRERELKAPYYKIEGQKAIPIMGTYVEDLFRVKQEGVLKARGIFD